MINGTDIYIAGKIIEILLYNSRNSIEGFSLYFTLCPLITIVFTCKSCNPILKYLFPISENFISLEYKIILSKSVVEYLKYSFTFLCS